MQTFGEIEFRFPTTNLDALIVIVCMHERLGDQCTIIQINNNNTNLLEVSRGHNNKIVCLFFTFGQQIWPVFDFEILSWVRRAFVAISEFFCWHGEDFPFSCCFMIGCLSDLIGENGTDLWKLNEVSDNRMHRPN